MTRALRLALATRPAALVAVVLAFVGAPAAIMTALAVVSPPTLRFWHWLIAAAFLITSLAIALEAIAAGRRVHAPWAPTEPRSLSVLIAAYLPNEQAIIVDTLRHVLRELRVPSDRLQVILAYNTPSELHVEAILESLGRTAAQIVPLRVPGSRSKAENILAALPHLTGEMTVLLDADHHPAADAPARAWRWLTNGYDIVQGRCIVRNATHGLIPRAVAIEFEQMYGVSHQGRSLLVDTAIFGGTNGWWRTEVLREIGMDPRMLTEDIESAVRSIEAGYRIVHDRSIVSTELAPETWTAWWSQRLRWAQGWLQVAFRHQGELLRTEHLGSVQRLYWWYMLTWGAVFPVLAASAVSVLIADIASGRGLSLVTDPFLVFATVVSVAVQVLLARVTWRMASPLGRSVGLRSLVLYMFLAPVYAALKNAIAMIALLRELAAIDEWVVTTRASRSAPVVVEVT